MNKRRRFIAKRRQQMRRWQQEYESRQRYWLEYDEGYRNNRRWWLMDRLGK